MRRGLGITAAVTVALLAGAMTAAVAAEDETPPSIVLLVSGDTGNDGWFVTDVGLTWLVSDDESEITATDGCEPVEVTVDQQAVDYTCTATSSGGTSSLTRTVRRDATPPTVELLGGPADGGAYPVGEVPAPPDCAADDATSGLAGDCQVQGYGTEPGMHTVTASATDRAGTTATTSHTYEVVETAYELRGFFRPVRADGTNTVRAGRTVPLRFQVLDDGAPVTSTSVVESLTSRAVDCASGEPAGEPVPAAATGGTALRHDDGQFVHTWQVPDAPRTCHEVAAVMDDGQAVTAHFRIR